MIWRMRGSDLVLVVAEGKLSFSSWKLINTQFDSHDIHDVVVVIVYYYYYDLFVVLIDFLSYFFTA